MRANGSDELAARVAVAGACFCDRITLLPTRTRILLLQHPRERDTGIGTARMAHLALPNSRMRVGLDFGSDPVVRAELDEAPETYVLFPGAQSTPVSELPRDRDRTLIVLDGTWWQARKLLKLNPALASLPRVGFHPRERSAYRIRRQPADFCVSTIEALAEVLQSLEPTAGPFERLLDPFHAMVERQHWFQTEIHASRHRSTPREGPTRCNALATRLAASWTRLVCVQGEANAWPRLHPDRREAETVHWLAHRLASGATFESVIAPRQALGPVTHEHVELPVERLRGGGSVQDWIRAWNEFIRPDDILVTWGMFYRDLASAEGLPLTLPTVDLRLEVSRLLRRRAGSIESAMRALDTTPAPLGLSGRGGRRLAAVAGILASLRE